MISEHFPLMVTGQSARLIPVVADSKKEERATSTLLASFTVVPAFALEVFSQAGASLGKRSKIKCFTEVTFKGADKEKVPRPDGLVVITNGSKIWSALIESKIGNAELSVDQVEEYLTLARTHKIDAVITISNQFAITPTHHPIKVSKAKTRSVELYHFSWLAIKSKAVLLTSEKGVDDPEQAYILNELVRYLDHESSGVSNFNRMPSIWKDLCLAVQNGSKLNRNSELVVDSVAAWHQLLRQLSLDLSMAVGSPVEICLSRSRDKDADANLVQDCTALASESCLTAEFSIPNAATRIGVSADITRKVVTVSMKLAAPKDTKRATASVNWLTRQFKGRHVDRLSVIAHWPGRTPTTMAPMAALFESPALLVPEGSSAMPSYLEVVSISDIGARFKGAKTFVEDVREAFPSFYHDAGQHIKAWLPKPPKMTEKDMVENGKSETL
jgi:hypothetical protein